MKSDTLLLIAVLALVVLLALKSLKQAIFLSFTLLSFKAVWIVLIVLLLVRSLKKNAHKTNKS